MAKPTIKNTLKHMKRVNMDGLIRHATELQSALLIMEHDGLGYDTARVSVKHVLQFIANDVQLLNSYASDLSKLID